MGKELGNIISKISSGVLIRLCKIIDCSGHEDVLLQPPAVANIID